MKSPLFIAGIENLSLKTTPKRGDSVANAFWVTTDPQFVKELIPESTRDSMGTLELRSLLDGKPVAYTRFDVAITDDTEAHKHLEAWLRIVTTFLHHIWFCKDHAANLEFGYLVRPVEGGLRITRNFLGMIVTTALEE